MVNHTIHTCEQRVRFPLSAIVIFIHYITTILYSTPHIHKPTHIYSPDPNKTTSPFILYKCVDITLLQTKLYLHLLPYSLLLLTKYIYILSYLLLITTTIYIPTYNQNTPLSQIDRYISYIHNYYLLTYTENRTHLSIHLFHPTIV